MPFKRFHGHGIVSFEDFRSKNILKKVHTVEDFRRNKSRYFSVRLVIDL